MRLYSRRLDKPGPLRAIGTGAGSPGTIILACTELVQACGLTSSIFEAQYTLKKSWCIRAGTINSVYFWSL